MCMVIFASKAKCESEMTKDRQNPASTGPATTRQIAHSSMPIASTQTACIVN